MFHGSLEMVATMLNKTCNSILWVGLAKIIRGLKKSLLVKKNSCNLDLKENQLLSVIFEKKYNFEKYMKKKMAILLM